MESLDTVRWLDLDIRLMTFGLLNLLLLLQEKSLLCLRVKELLLVVRLMLALSQLLVLYAQAESSIIIGCLHLSLTMQRSKLLLADVRRLGQ